MSSDFDVPLEASTGSDDSATHFEGDPGEQPPSPASEVSGRSHQEGVPILAQPVSPVPTYRRSLFRR